MFGEVLWWFSICGFGFRGESKRNCWWLLKKLGGSRRRCDKLGYLKLCILICCEAFRFFHHQCWCLWNQKWKLSMLWIANYELYSINPNLQQVSNQAYSETEFCISFKLLNLTNFRTYTDCLYCIEYFLKDAIDHINANSLFFLLFLIIKMLKLKLFIDRR